MTENNDRVITKRSRSHERLHQVKDDLHESSSRSIIRFNSAEASLECAHDKAPTRARKVRYLLSQPRSPTRSTAQPALPPRQRARSGSWSGKTNLTDRRLTSRSGTASAIGSGGTGFG